MSYNPLFPPPTISPKNSAPQILPNFAQYAAIFSSNSGTITYNHWPFNDPNQGKHAAVILQTQAAAPGVNTSLAALFGMNVGLQSGVQPMLQAQIQKFLPTDYDSTNAQNTPMQLTYNQVTISAPPFIGDTQFQSFLPGGYVFYFGKTTTANMVITVTPTPVKLLMAQAFASALINKQGTSGVDVYTTLSVNTNMFTITSQLAVPGTIFFWMAIGLN